MTVWLHTATASTDNAMSDRPAAIILAGSESAAVALLTDRLQAHSTRNQNPLTMISPPDGEGRLSALVSPDWPVSLLTRGLDLPPRPISDSLGDAEGLNVTRFDPAGLVAEIERMHTDETQRCFALVEGAAFPNLPELLELSGLEHTCLFHGSAKETAGAVAHWLICLKAGNATSERLCRTALNKPGGYPLLSWSVSAWMLLTGSRGSKLLPKKSVENLAKPYNEGSAHQGHSLKEFLMELRVS